MTDLTLSILCFCGMFGSIRTIAWKMSVSRTVSVPMKRSSCCTYPDTAVSEFEVTATPLAYRAQETTLHVESSHSDFQNVQVHVWHSSHLIEGTMRGGSL